MHVLCTHTHTYVCTYASMDSTHTYVCTYIGMCVIVCALYCQTALGRSTVYVRTYVRVCFTCSSGESAVALTSKFFVCTYVRMCFLFKWETASFVGHIHFDCVLCFAYVCVLISRSQHVTDQRCFLSRAELFLCGCSAVFGQGERFY